jgi:hypothetical protein
MNARGWSGAAYIISLDPTELAWHPPSVINVKRLCWKHTVCDLSFQHNGKQKTHENERDTYERQTQKSWVYPSYNYQTQKSWVYRSRHTRGHGPHLTPPVRMPMTTPFLYFFNKDFFKGLNITSSMCINEMHTTDPIHEIQYNKTT